MKPFPEGLGAEECKHLSDILIDYNKHKDTDEKRLLRASLVWLLAEMNDPVPT